MKIAIQLFLMTAFALYATVAQAAFLVDYS